MHSGGTTGRRKEKTGRGGWARIRVWVSNWQPVTTADWPQVKDCLNCGAKGLTEFGCFLDFDCFWEVDDFDPSAKSIRMLATFGNGKIDILCYL